MVLVSRKSWITLPGEYRVDQGNATTHENTFYYSLFTVGGVYFLRHIEIPCIPPHCLVFYNSSISYLPGTLSTVHRPSVLSHSGSLIGTFHTWKYHWLTRQCPSRGLGASMGNNLSPLDIRSHALFLLDFVLWKWQTPFSVSEQMRKVVRLEKAKV